ncbi:MAG: UvrB/UvrC motif-containing protein, partial [Patescibacteria group bacterium]
QTDSVLEALILEANQIKKHQPPANAREKDDKSYNYVLVTKEDFPRILIVRGRELKVGPWESILKVRPWKTFGPFPHARELREGLKIIRKIFPYRDSKCKLGGRPCFNAQIGLCPGPCAGWITKKDYRKIIKHLILFFEARKVDLIKDLEKEMKSLAKEQKFEEANKVKGQLFALDHIQDVALIKQEVGSREKEVGFRIEAYDIAHISGTNVVGVMTVVEDGEVNKSQYRKFKIRADNPSRRAKLPTGQGNDDVGNLKQILERRLGHPEWRFPNMIVVDGGKGQINAARKVLEESGLEMIDVVSVVKDERHRAREILKGPTLNTNSQGRTLDRAILLANSEAHRFAIGYHRKLRGKGFRI